MPSENTKNLCQPYIGYRCLAKTLKDQSHCEHYRSCVKNTTSACVHYGGRECTFGELHTADFLEEIVDGWNQINSSSSDLVTEEALSIIKKLLHNHCMQAIKRFKEFYPYAIFSK